MTEPRLCLMPWISGSWLIQPRGPLLISLMVTNCSGKGLFQDSITETESKYTLKNMKLQ